MRNTLLSLLFVITLVHAQRRCIWYSPEEIQYDFSSVGQIDAISYDDLFSYSLNLCGSADHCNGFAACQYYPKRNETHILVPSPFDLVFTTDTNTNVKAKLTSNNGEYCETTGMKRTTIIKFVCGKQRATAKEDPTCVYTFEVPTPANIPCSTPAHVPTPSSRTASTGISFVVVGIVTFCALIILILIRCRQHAINVRNAQNAQASTTTTIPPTINIPPTATYPMGTMIYPAGDSSGLGLGPAPMVGLAPAPTEQLMPVYVQTQAGVVPYVMSVGGGGNGAVVYYPQQMV